MCAAATELRQQPPTLPAPFWDHFDIRAAAEARHMGKLIAAYRRHPHHGRAIAQDTMAAWAGLTQAQISRLERGRPERHLDRLAFWADLLHMPPALRWFDIPSPTPSLGRPDGDQPHDPTDPNGPTNNHHQIDSQPDTPIFDSIEVIERRRSRAIATNIDEVVLTHIEAEICHIVAVYEQHSPLELAPRIRNLRARALSLLEERQLPRQRERLYAAAARLSGVHGVIAMDVGRFTVASHYGAEAFAFAEAIRQPDVQAWVRAGQSLIAYYSGKYDDALAFARDGLARSPYGPQAVRLAINGQARALARLGDSRGVDVAVEHGLAALPSADSTVSPSLSLDTYCEARGAANAATAYLLLGRHAEAKAHAHHSLAAFDRAELHGPRALSRLDLATAELQRPARDVDLGMRARTPSRR
ncbi:helix-turn-helix domain-containing protein [Dactylosporangium cerinum]